MNGVYERFPIPWVVRSRQHSWCVMDANGLAIACGLTEPLARLIAGAPDAAAEIARLREEVKRWKAEAMAARPFIDMRCIEAWQPDGFHPGIPTHIEYKAARAANGGEA